jgi:hypothetical protein
MFQFFDFLDKISTTIKINRPSQQTSSIKIANQIKNPKKMLVPIYQTKNQAGIPIENPSIKQKIRLSRNDCAISRI